MVINEWWWWWWYLMMVDYIFSSTDLSINFLF
jgi:hypothetical protein